MMAKYRLLVRTQAPDSTIWEPDQVVDWDGGPRWQFEPVDPVERAQWEAEVFDYNRYMSTPERHRAPLADEADGYAPAPPKPAHFPPSGWQEND